ncbi:hypothetical protein [Dactylosporangium sp. CA-233914]|uniref:hypothetical protein n=1 Tax=Dactylosporangium sp. CA-233914 TaxID=3239934 RepID=UPI003D8D1030
MSTTTPEWFSVALGSRPDEGATDVDGTGHHIMLDQPLALATALRTLLADWDHSQPSAGPVAVGARPQGSVG